MGLFYWTQLLIGSALTPSSLRFKVRFFLGCGLPLLLFLFLLGFALLLRSQPAIALALVAGSHNAKLAVLV